MRKAQPQILIGLLLIVGGLLFLLQSLGLLPAGSALFWTLAFATGGAIFLYVFLLSGDNWWAAIPSAALFGVAASIALGAFFPAHADPWGGALFMGVLSLGFWAVWLANRNAWWAIIPAGAVLSVAAMTLAGTLADGEMAALTVLFIGMGLTFGLLLLVPTPEGRMRWPLVPALVLLLLGAVSSLVFSSSLSYMGPALLILGGILLILRVLRK